MIFFAVCREWGVREDGALAYRLQNEESKLYIHIYACLKKLKL